MLSDPTASASPRLRKKLALHCAAIVLLIGFLATSALLTVLARHNHQQAQAGLQAIAHSVAQTIANQITRAVRLGIPVSEIPGVKAHLEQTLNHTPEIAYLAITDTHGAPMYAVTRGTTGALQTLPITIKNQTVASVQAAPRHQQAQGLLQPALACITVVLLVSGFIGWAIYLGPALRLQRRHTLLQDSLRHKKPLALESRDITDPLQQAMQTLAALQVRNQQALQAVQDYAAEIRAVEFDKKTLEAIDTIAQQAIKTGSTQ